MSASCSSCLRTNNDHNNFILTCNQCERAWHHRCHRPVVSDKDLIRIIKDYNSKFQNPNVKPPPGPRRPHWTCGTCVKGKGKLSTWTTAAESVNANTSNREASSSRVDGASTRSESSSGPGSSTRTRPQQTLVAAKSTRQPSNNNPPAVQRPPTPIVIDDDDDDDIVIVDGPRPLPVVSKRAQPKQAIGVSMKSTKSRPIVQERERQRQMEREQQWTAGALTSATPGTAPTSRSSVQTSSLTAQPAPPAPKQKQYQFVTKKTSKPPPQQDQAQAPVLQFPQVRGTGIRIIDDPFPLLEPDRIHNSNRKKDRDTRSVSSTGLISDFIDLSMSTDEDHEMADAEDDLTPPPPLPPPLPLQPSAPSAPSPVHHIPPPNPTPNPEATPHPEPQQASAPTPVVTSSEARPHLQLIPAWINARRSTPDAEPDMWQRALARRRVARERVQQVSATGSASASAPRLDDLSLSTGGPGELDGQATIARDGVRVLPKSRRGRKGFKVAAAPVSLQGSELASGGGQLEEKVALAVRVPTTPFFFSADVWMNEKMADLEF